MIHLQSGRVFYFDRPFRQQRHAFAIEDVAHSLSRLCRFTGHVSKFYSVAEHCVRVSRMVPPEHAMTGLLHDCAEYLIGDVSSPLKKHLASFRMIEAALNKELAEVFGFEFPFPVQVEFADKLACAQEGHYLKGWTPPEVSGPPPACLSPLKAKYEFLHRYNELKAGNEHGTL